MKKFLVLSLIVVFVLISTPACKKFVWNPVGTWNLQANIEDLGPLTVSVNLTGNENGGSVSGWTLYNPDNTNGTWTKTGDYTISITIDYVNAGWITFNNSLEVTGTTTKSSPNSVVLTGTFTESSFLFGETVHSVTITATKTSNLQ